MLFSPSPYPRDGTRRVRLEKVSGFQSWFACLAGRSSLDHCRDKFSLELELCRSKDMLVG